MVDTNPISLEKSKRKIRKIDSKIVSKIMSSLYGGRMKKTNLAMECRLSFDKCMLYLDWMKAIGLIETKVDAGGFELFCLTERGMDLYRMDLFTTS